MCIPLIFNPILRCFGAGVTDSFRLLPDPHACRLSHVASSPLDISAAFPSSSLVGGSVIAVSVMGLLEQSKQAPMAALTLVYNAILSWRILKERFTRGKAGLGSCRTSEDVLLFFSGPRSVVFGILLFSFIHPVPQLISSPQL